MTRLLARGPVYSCQCAAINVSMWVPCLALTFSASILVTLVVHLEAYCSHCIVGLFHLLTDFLLITE